MVLRSHPSIIATSFSTPANFIEDRHDTPSTIDESSIPLHFLPIFSPSPNTDIASGATTPKTSRQFNQININIEQSGSGPKSSRIVRPKFKEANINATSPSIIRKQSIQIDLNRKKENQIEKRTKFSFPAISSIPVLHRSRSAHSALNRYRML